MTKVHFSSQRLDWKTPKAVYQVLDAEFKFDHDPCPPKYKINGLKSEWGGRIMWIHRTAENYQSGLRKVLKNGKKEK